MNQQDVIKRFMASLANHGYASSNTVGKDMLDGAIRASSRYLSATDAIDAMKADQVAAEKAAVEEVLGSGYAGKTLVELPSNILSAAAKDYDTNNIGNGYFNDTNDARSTVERLIKERKSIIFLRDYCGIVLEDRCFIDDNDNVTHYNNVTTGNVDTGAITGSDAGGSVEKTAASVVPETFANTYKATTSAAQTIVTNERNWVIQATAGNDNITANSADSINAGDGNDTITVNASGATIDSGAGNDTVTVSENVDDITLSDLTSNDTLTIGGTFEVGSAKLVDGLLVVTDKTGTRKLRFGNYTDALDAKLNSTTVGQWLTNSGVDLDNLASSNYSDGKVNGSSGNVVADDGRIALDDYTPTPAEEPAAPKLMFRRLRDASLTVNGINVDASQAGNVTDGDENVIGAVSNEFPNAETFTRNGLTIHLLGESSNSSTGNITAKTFAELDDNQKTIVAALFKWWAAEALKLNEESYGIGFNSPTATVKDIGLYFYTDNNSGTLAAVNQRFAPCRR